MKGIILLLMFLVAILIIPVVAIASDTTGAHYRTDIVISNNGTATTSTANFTLSTAGMITAGMLNASANNCAMLIGGVDVPFGPSVNASYPWNVFVGSIAASASKNAYLYSGNVTGGDIYWFPGTTGGTVVDAPNLELGANYTIEWYGYVDASGGGYLVFKDSAILLDINVANSLYLAHTAAGIGAGIGTITSGLHKVELYQNAASSNITVEVDDNIVGTIDCSSTAVADNGNTWYFSGKSGFLSAFVYLYYIKVYVGGTLQGYWYWEYNTTFADHSDDATSNPMTPTFRTTSSDADVSAVVSGQSCLLTSDTPSGGSTEGWTMITTLPSGPAGLYTEGGTDFPWGAEITAVEDEARLPNGTFLFPFAFGTAVLLGLIVFKLSHNEKRGVKGSLMLMCFTIEGVMAFWYFIGGGVIPGWTLVPFGLASALLLIWRNPFSPVSS